MAPHETARSEEPPRIRLALARPLPQAQTDARDEFFSDRYQTGASYLAGHASIAKSAMAIRSCVCIPSRPIVDMPSRVIM